MKFVRILHPILFALSPVLSLLAANIDQLPIESAIRSLFLSLLIAIMLLLSLRLLIRDWHRAALVVSFIVLVFFSYGHLYNVIKPWNVGGMYIGRHRYLLPGVAILLGLGLWGIIRKLKRVETMEIFFNILGIILFLFPVTNLLTYAAARVEIRQPENQSPAIHEYSSELIDEDNRPDVYYFIVDGYAREDVLQDLYDYDNSDFIRFLRRNGFFVADRSTSNYTSTSKSLASSLNMEYLHTLAEEFEVDFNDSRPLRDLLHHSRVRAILGEMGYPLVAFETGWALTTIGDADIFLRPGGEVQPPPYLSWTMNEFELLLLRSSLVRAFYDLKQQSLGKPVGPVSVLHQLHRNRIHFTLNMLEEIPEWEGDYLVFAHILIPHPPFVFGPDGETVTPSWEFTFQDATAYPGSREDYIDGYTSQLEYLNKLLQRVLSRILESSEPLPIIILQADHGPRAFRSWDSIDDTNVREGLAILNAYHLPGYEGEPIDPSITPVNTFRIILNAYFGGDKYPLENISYFTTHSDPYEFIDVTDQILTP